MEPRFIVGTVAALSTAVLLVVLDIRDFDREPPTDTADVVATAAVFIGGALWFGLRWANNTKRSVQLVRVFVAGVALSALVLGLASAIYDPFAN